MPRFAYSYEETTFIGSIASISDVRTVKGGSEVMDILVYADFLNSKKEKLTKRARLSLWRRPPRDGNPAVDDISKAQRLLTKGMQVKLIGPTMPYAYRPRNAESDGELVLGIEFDSNFTTIVPASMRRSATAPPQAPTSHRSTAYRHPHTTTPTTTCSTTQPRRQSHSTTTYKNRNRYRFDRHSKVNCLGKTAPVSGLNPRPP